MDFEVLRRHEGDKLYEEGDTRQANAADVAHLVKQGVLRQVGQGSVQPVGNETSNTVEGAATLSTVEAPALTTEPAGVTLADGVQLSPIDPVDVVHASSESAVLSEGLPQVAVTTEVNPENKVEPVPTNKAEVASPKNKSK